MNTAQIYPSPNTQHGLDPLLDSFTAMPMYQDDEPGMEEPTRHLEVLLIYEDDTTAWRARHAVDHVLNRPETRTQYHIQPWKLDQLRQAEGYGQAIHDALAADVVVLSTHGKNVAGLQAAARLMQWVGLKRGTPCGLLISVHPVDELFTDETPELNELCAAAARNGMTVIFHAGEPRGSQFGAAMSQIKPDLLAAISPEAYATAACSS
jgi:hypothetical protein